MTKMKGFVHVYTGNGKGKTTAALGLALRAAGAGYHVFIAQFVKGSRYSEMDAIERFSDLITLRQYGKGYFINRDPSEEDIISAKAGLDEVKEVMASGRYRLVILDEANIAVHRNLFSLQDLLELIRARPEDVEIVITGRYASPGLLEQADLVTEMVAVKHYFDQGIPARRGIEK